MLKNRKKFITLIIILAALIVFAAGGVAYAYLSQSVHRSQGMEIKATNVSFRFNEKTYLDTIREEDIAFVKGEPLDVPMTVEVVGGVGINVSYTIEFSLDLAENLTEDITPAVEVYVYNGNRYEYLCMLNELENHSIDGTMTSGFYEVIDMRLVFSSAAGAYYDQLALSGAGFKLTAVASAEIYESKDVIFVGDYAAFRQAFSTQVGTNKTIILNADITVPQTLTSTGIVGIDLNGYTLTVEQNLNINCRNYKSGRFGITNGRTTGGLVVPSGVINLVNLSRVYLIDNDIQSSSIFATNTFQASTGLNVASLISDLSDLLKERSAVFNNGAVYKSGADMSFILDDIAAYTTSFNISASDTSVIKVPSMRVTVNDDYTDRYFFDFLLSYVDSEGAITATKTVSGHVTVRGNSTQAIAEDLLKSIPDYVDRSVFLKAYDELTGSLIEWYFDDGAAGVLLTQNGIYRAGGLNSMLNDTKITDFSDKDLKLYVKVAKDGTTGSFDASEAVDPTLEAGDTYLAANKKIQVVSPEERTKLIFDNVPVILDNALPLYDINADYLIETYLAKTGLSGVKLRIIGDSTTPPTGATYQYKDFMQISNTGLQEKYNTLHIAKTEEGEYNAVPKEVLGAVEIEITFEYADGRKFIVNKDVSVSSDFLDVTKFDMTYRLQSAFSMNEYIDKVGYEFYAYGALLPKVEGVAEPVYIDYKVLAPADDYISIVYRYVRVPNNDEMDEQIAYFTQSGSEYVIVPAEDIGKPDVEYYEYKAVVEVLSSRIPSTDALTAYIEATLYTKLEDGTPARDEDGNLIYIDPYTGVQYVDPETELPAILTYNLTLDIEGVIHSGAQIADANLYYALRDVFDLNGDGVISSSEANNWEGAVAKGSTYLATYNAAQFSGTPYSGYNKRIWYINLASMPITSLKGLEYFPGVQGYNLQNTGRIDVSIFSKLSNLVYLNLRSNSITDITPFAYLDYLEYLDLYGNKVSDIEPLRYLPRLYNLNLQSNSVKDLAGLTELTTLRTLVLTGNTSATGLSFSNDELQMYYLTLIKVNNTNVLPGQTYSTSITISYSPAINPSSEMQVAAKVIRDLEEINRVQKVLYMPRFYYYPNQSGALTKYELYWFINDVNEKNLIIHNDERTGDLTGYTVNSPLMDKEMTISVKVYIPGTANSYVISRDFNITLERSTPDEMYIYDESTDRYVLASEAIPDENLRIVLFDMFNADMSEDTITILTNNGEYVSSSERYIISDGDFAFYKLNYSSLYYLTGRDIKDLTGIGYFSSLFKTGLDLTNNTFSDLSPLNGLDNLTSLYLGGNKYDFNELMETETQFGLSKLTQLHVYNCYNLEDEDVINGLFEVYAATASPQLNIYMKQGVIWNPYETILPKLALSLPSIAKFEKSGDTYSFYDGRTYIPITLYGKVHQVTVPSMTFYNRWNSDTVYFSYNTTTGTITYNLMFAAESTGYARCSIRILSARGVAVDYANRYFVELYCPDMSEIIFVHNLAMPTQYSYVPYDDSFSVKSLHDLIPSHDLRAAALTRFFYYINTATGSYVHWVKASSVADLKSRGLYAYYYDTATGIYHITTQMFAATYNTTSYRGPMYGVAGSLYNNSTLYVYGARDGDNLLGGLRYFTGIKTLSIYRNGNFGDGADMCNITSLTTQYTAIDFTTISYDCPNLVTMNLATYYFFNVGTGADSAFKHFPNLGSLTIGSGTSTYAGSYNTHHGYQNDFSFLEALIVDGKTKLRTLNFYAVTNNTITDVASATTVKKLYLASLADAPTATIYYRVGSPTSRTQNGYFRLIDGEMWYCTSNSDTTKTSSWSGGEADTKVMPEVTDAYNFGQAITTSTVYDLALRYGATSDSAVYWANAPTYSLSTSDSIFLPTNIGKDFYGLLYGDMDDPVEFKHTYNISWKYWLITPSTNHRTAYTAISVTNTPGTDYTELKMSNFGDCYLVVAGNFVSPQTYSFLYQFTVGAGDGVFSEVESDILRFWLFGYSGTYRTASTVNIMTASSTYAYKLATYYLYAQLGLGTPINSNSTSYRTTYHYYDYVYSIKGIDIVFKAWGNKDTLTSFTMQGQRFTDITPLYEFKGLRTVDLSGANTSYYSYLTLNGIDGTTSDGQLIWPNLQHLTLNYSINISPRDLTLVAATARPLLSSISVYYTKCMYTMDSVTAIQAIITKCGINSLTLKLNSTSAYAFTAATLASFVSDVSPGNLYPGVISTGSTVFLSTNEVRTVNGRSYTVQFAGSVRTMLQRYKVSNEEIDVKLYITGTPYTTLNGMYVSGFKFYDPSATTKLTFGWGSMTIDEFDTELIAFMLVSGYMTSPRTGHYNASNANRVLSNIEIKEIGSAAKDLYATSGSSYTISWQPNTYTSYMHYGLAYKERFAVGSFPSAVPTTVTPLSSYARTFTSIASINRLGTSNMENFSFFGDLQPTYTGTLPTHIYFLRQKYEIMWTVDSNFTGSYVDCTTAVIDSDMSEGAKFTISPTTLPLSQESGTFTVRFKYTIVGSTMSGYSSTKNITFTKTADTRVSHEYQYFVEVEQDGNDAVFYDNSNNVYYRIEDADIQTLYRIGSIYYSDASSGGTPVSVVTANQIFPDRMMQRFLMVRYCGSYIAFKDATNRLGYVLPISLIESTTSIDFAYSTWSSSTSSAVRSVGINSIEGIQIFRKLNTFISRSNNIVDISPLRTLSLKTFYIGTTVEDANALYAGASAGVTDFSPLLEGSKDSLEYFTGNATNVGQIIDYSFLLAFTKLKEVYVASAVYSNYVYGLYSSYYYTRYGLFYFTTPSGKFLINELRNRGIYIYTYSNYISNSTNYLYDSNLAYDSTKSKPVADPNNLAKCQTLYAIKTSITYELNYQVLKDFSSNSPYTDFLDGYVLSVNRFTSQNTTTNTYAFEVPGTLQASDGSMHMIDWFAMSQCMTVGGYDYIEDGVVVESNITKERAEEIVSTIDYYNKAKNGEARIITRITAQLTRFGDEVAPNTGVYIVDFAKAQSDMRLMCHIDYDGISAERVLTVKFNP